MKVNPLAVVVLDASGHIVAAQRQLLGVPDAGPVHREPIRRRPRTLRERAPDVERKRLNSVAGAVEITVY